MSAASAMPAVSPASSAPWMIVPGDDEAEVGRRRRGTPRRPCAALVPLAITASSMSGSTNVGISSCARRNCTRQRAAAERPRPRGPRAPRALTAAAVGLAAAAAPSRCEPVTASEDVVERRRLDLDGLDLDAALVERADHRRDRGLAARRCAARRASGAPGRGGSTVAERGERLARAPGALRVGELDVQRRLADARLERRRACPRRRACRAAMIPTRSASCSASSRYCVVRKTVVPSSLSARTSRHSAARLVGSRPVVGSSRNSTCGRCTSASARSSRRRMPPE